jgi:hypothetical protein
MASEKILLEALDVLTDGPAAVDAGLSSSREPGETFRSEALEVHKAARPWTTGRGIQGLGIAEKITDSEQLDELVLKIYVREKLPKSKLKANLVPKTVVVPGQPDPVPTDVEEIGLVGLEPNTTRVRPAIPGFSVGHFRITAGTLGCLVRKQDDDKSLYILSNSHVLANEGLGSKGDSILQPGKANGGKAPADVLAELDSWEPFVFTASSYPNLVDAAIAKVKSAKNVTSAIRLIGVPAGVSSTLRRGMQVQKTGRTTDRTIGLVKDINYRTALQYRKTATTKGRVGFREQMLCTRFTAPGDSGSAVLNMNRQVVGLHFAGSASSSIFNRIGHVLSALKVTLITTRI